MNIHYGGALTFLDGLNLEETLGSRYGVAVSAENDAKSATLCEQWLGELKGVDTRAVMTPGHWRWRRDRRRRQASAREQLPGWGTQMDDH
ncbi:MAG: ROK family protein [Lactobacillus delbrueckii]|jgi:hypothetical protein|uniref:ROK family protein n=1 Tax=Lactobacillus delbrueckii TaxID=1584 RepID=UPI000230ECAA